MALAKPSTLSVGERNARRGRGARLRGTAGQGETVSPRYGSASVPVSPPLIARRGPRLSSESPPKERHCKHGVTGGSSCSIKMAFQCLKQKHGLNRKKDQKDFCPLLFFSVFALSIQSDASTEWEDFPNGFVTTLSLVT